MKYSWWLRLRVWLFGVVKLTDKLYLSECHIHGYYEDTLHGFPGSEYLQCPECLRERDEKPVPNK